MRALVPWLVLLPGLVAPQGAQTRKADSRPADSRPADSRPADPRKDLADLARDLDAAFAAKDSERAFALLEAFAAAHHVPDKTVELLSPDQSVQVVLGANGTTKRPDAPDVDFTPKGNAYSIAVGGEAGPADQGAGGKGGTVWLKGEPKGKVLLLGGKGGPGAPATADTPGGAGGTGGDVWLGAFRTGAVTGKGGPGGAAGAGTQTQPPGAGGNGGDAGPAPPRKR